MIHGPYSVKCGCSLYHAFYMIVSFRSPLSKKRDLSKSYIHLTIVKNEVPAGNKFYVTSITMTNQVGLM